MDNIRVQHVEITFGSVYLLIEVWNKVIAFESKRLAKRCSIPPQFTVSMIKMYLQTVQFLCHRSILLRIIMIYVNLFNIDFSVVRICNEKHSIFAQWKIMKFESTTNGDEDAALINVIQNYVTLLSLTWWSDVNKWDELILSQVSQSYSANWNWFTWEWI